MTVHVQRGRPQRRPRAARLVPRPIATRAIARAEVAAPGHDGVWPVSVPSSAWAGFRADSYVDYARVLTSEGGIHITYKDLDLRWRHTLWRVFAWAAASGAEGWYLFTVSPVQSAWLNILCFVAIAVINWLIVRKPVEVYRTIEIRPDCL